MLKKPAPYHKFHESQQPVVKQGFEAFVPDRVPDSPELM